MKMNNKIDVLTIAEKILEDNPNPNFGIYSYYKDFLIEIEDIIDKEFGNIFDTKDRYIPDKYVSHPPIYYSEFRNLCFCKKMKSLPKNCFHFTSSPCNKRTKKVYCWSENGIIKHDVGKCPYSEYRIEENENE
jgi:hypothetical protein